MRTDGAVHPASGCQPENQEEQGVAGAEHDRVPLRPGRGDLRIRVAFWEN